MSFQFPKELDQAVRWLSQKTGRDTESLVIELLSQALGVLPPNSEISTADPASDIPGSGITASLFLAMSDTYSDQRQSFLMLQETQRRTMQTLRANQPIQTLDQILSAFSDLVFVQDRRGRFIYINLEATVVLGLERNYFLGKTFQDLALSTAALELLAVQGQSVLESGRSVKGKISLPTADRLTRNYDYIFSPIQETDGRIESIVFVARDITERQQATVSLQESEERYRFLFESAGDSIVIVDALTYRILNVNWNAVRLFERTRRELLQMSLWDIEGLIREADRAAILQQLETAGSATFEYTHCQKDGTEILVEISTQVIEYGDRLAFQSFVRDISDRKQKEAEIRTLSAELEQRVLERTRELSDKNQELTQAITELVAINQNLQNTLEELQSSEAGRLQHFF